MPDLAFTDVLGKAGKLSDYGDKKALVIAYTNVGCPLCKRYGPRLGRISAEAEKRDAAFLFVNPSPQDGEAEIAGLRKQYKLVGRYVHDKDRAITAALGATTSIFPLVKPKILAEDILGHCLYIIRIAFFF